ncbi:MAG TPA: alanine racemase [bacterium (Candidatus Stahlbacteria)]|nr:alanine racemase [Candidatus Stahlbacteria bacterium]
MHGRTWAEINLDRLGRNYHRIKDIVGNAKVLAAVKADAYGHGAVQVAHKLEKEGIDYFGVAGVEEGVELRESGLKKPILILSPVPFDMIGQLFEYDLIPTISESAMIEKLSQFTKRSGQLEVHIEIDTGMTRTGFSSHLAVDRIKKIAETTGLKIGGIFSHFAVAENDPVFTMEQLTRFKKIVDELKKSGLEPPLIHIANSAAILKFKLSHLDLVRPGLALYGLVEGFEPILNLKSKVVNIRKVKKGVGISYGLKFRTRKESIIATVSAGYGDGLPRSVSSKGEVVIRGRRAPIVGVVCMDLFMVDVTAIPEVTLNDEVVIIGEDLPAGQVAGWADTIVYELVTNIGPRVPRIFFEGGKVIEIRDLLKRRHPVGGNDEKACSDSAFVTRPLRSGTGTRGQER